MIANLVSEHGIRTSIHGQANLEIAKRHIEKGKPLFVIANHFDKFDPAVAIKAISQFVTSVDGAYVFISQRQLDYFVNGIAMKAYAENLGFIPVPVIQPKDQPVYDSLKNIGKDQQEKSGIVFDAVKRKLTLKKAKQKLIEHEKNGTEPKEHAKSAIPMDLIKKLKRGERVVIFIWPEGTRSKTGGLLQAADGIGRLLSINKEAMVLPFSLENKKIKLGRTVTEAVVGTPFTYADIQKDKEERVTLGYPLEDADYALLRVGDNLTDESRGVYSRFPKKTT